MKNIPLSLSLILLFISCSQKDEDADKSFDKYKESFIEAMWKQYPGHASAVGYHKYDSILSLPDEASRKSEIAFSRAHLDSLKDYESRELNANNIIELKIIRNELERVIFENNQLRSFEWDPSDYNVSGQFAELLIGTYEPLDSRLRSFAGKLKNVPAYYEAAKRSLKNPTREHKALAISQGRGGLSVFAGELNDALAKSGLSTDEKTRIIEDAAKATAAINGYIAFLETLDNPNPRSFRLGSDLYAKKFEFDIVSSFTAEEIYNKAVAHKKELHDRMYVLSEKLWPKYMGNAAKPSDRLAQIKMVIDKISLQHTTPENFQAEIEKQIPELTAFINKKDLLYLDPAKPLVVRREPDYMAGVAGASISAPGPYDKNGNTYYNVGSLSGWPAEKSESFLREYNDYILQILNIHEAIPGHYTQLVYSNNSPSMIKSVFGNGAMVEGWAVYTELMMLENGYKNSDEMWLMYYKWNMRSTCNTILDISVHTKNMSREQALDLLIKEAFQQQAEADGKWNRVNLTQVQLCSYFTGYTEIYELRERIKNKEGDKFNLKDFHTKFLSYGSAPVKYIREMMLVKK